MILMGSLTATIAVYLDTVFYTTGPLTLSTLIQNPIVTPLNNILYNTETKNLAEHGLHPYYQHFIVNLTQLLGPAYVLLALPRLTLRLASAIFGIFVLSLAQHQEARFLIPSIPLILSSVRLPPRFASVWVGLWIAFNAVFGVLMGTYHQGGVIPTQLFLAGQTDATQALWWRTYSPPIWLLDGKSGDLTTRDLMGMQADLMVDELRRSATCHPATSASTSSPTTGTYLVAPQSSTFLDRFSDSYGNGTEPTLRLERKWHYRNHLNLDDLDFAEAGVWPTLRRVIGRRGLTTWRVTKACPP